MYEICVSFFYIVWQSNEYCNRRIISMTPAISVIHQLPAHSESRTWQSDSHRYLSVNQTASRKLTLMSTVVLCTQTCDSDRAQTRVSEKLRVAVRFSESHSQTRQDSRCRVATQLCTCTRMQGRTREGILQILPAYKLYSSLVR